MRLSSAAPPIAALQADVALRGRFHVAADKPTQVLLAPMIAGFLSILGVASIAPAAASLWQLWRTDPLKSVGSLIPLVSLVLIYRAWRSLGWRSEGSWWGVLPLALAVGLVALRQHALFELVLSPSWTISLPPPSFVVLLYGFGCVLIFGGVPLLRAALFPVLLLPLVNPVPQMLVRRVDLPLQQASAHLARAVAHGLGAQLNPGQLRLMFTPEFGMFIAPGCDGMRGSVAMGLLGLVGGYLMQLRPRRWILLVCAGVSLGYLLNLLRLCGLVFYYVLALHLPVLQNHAEGADYALGALLFSGTAAAFFALLTRPEALPARHTVRNVGSRERQSPRACAIPLSRTNFTTLPHPSRPFGLQCAAFAAIVLLGAAPFARALWTPAGGKSAGGAPAESAGPAPFPQRLGSFALRRTWEERLSSGVLLYRWAEYGRADVAQAVTVGISATLGTHDPLLCHMVRGEDWRWHGDLKLLTGDGRRTAFSGTFFEDGVVRTLEVHTLCGAERCGQFTLGHRRSGFILSFASAPGAMLATEPARPIGMLLRAESTDVQSEPETAREQLNLLLADFAAALDPVSLSRIAS